MWALQFAYLLVLYQVILPNFDLEVKKKKRERECTMNTLIQKSNQ